VDTRYVRAFPIRKWEEAKAEDTVIDNWGTKWHKPKSSHYWDPISFPLANATLDDLKSYHYPNSWNRNYEKEMIKAAERLHKDTEYYIVGDSGTAGIFEQCWMIRGLQSFLMDLLVNIEFAEKLLDIVLEQRKEFYGRFLNAVGPYVSMVTVSDDMGNQQGLLVSPQLYRRLIKPRHKELYSFIKQQADVKIFLHCCGAVSELIDDFVEEGVDVLNPVQVSARGMDSARLKRDFGGKIVFWGGGCDVQTVLHHGSPDDVRSEVTKRMADFKPGGGFVFAATTPIQPQTAPENILAMYNTALEHRHY